VKGTRSWKGDASQQRPALDSLDARKKAVVLDALLHIHAELREEAEKITHGMLVDVDPEAVADGVERDLRALSIDELNGRAGRQRGGYVEPTDAAWELLGEAVEPHSREVERLLTLGLVQPAVDTALGVVAGLYRCRGCQDGDVLLSWAPDFPAEEAAAVLKRLTDAGCDIPPESLANSVPEWADWLDAVGPVGP
jgi:hypothetical protein